MTSVCSIREICPNTWSLAKKSILTRTQLTRVRTIQQMTTTVMLNVTMTLWKNLFSLALNLSGLWITSVKPLIVSPWRKNTSWITTISSQEYCPLTAYCRAWGQWRGWRKGPPRPPRGPPCSVWLSLMRWESRRRQWTGSVSWTPSITLDQIWDFGQVWVCIRYWSYWLEWSSVKF